MRIAWRTAAALGVSGVAAGALVSSQYAPGAFSRPLVAPGANGPFAVAMCDAATAQSTGADSGEATRISGKKISEEIRDEIRVQTAMLKREHGVTPGLAVVLVGNRTDSATYVRAKKAMAESVGFLSIDCTFDEDVSQQEVLDCVTALNEDPRVHAILVQLPLPAHIDEHKVGARSLCRSLAPPLVRLAGARSLCSPCLSSAGLTLTPPPLLALRLRSTPPLSRPALRWCLRCR